VAAAAPPLVPPSRTGGRPPAVTAGRGGGQGRLACPDRPDRGDGRGGPFGRPRSGAVPARGGCAGGGKQDNVKKQDRLHSRQPEVRPKAHSAGNLPAGRDAGGPARGNGAARSCAVPNVDHRRKCRPH